MTISNISLSLNISMDLEDEGNEFIFYLMFHYMSYFMFYYMFYFIFTILIYCLRRITRDCLMVVLYSQISYLSKFYIKGDSILHRCFYCFSIVEKVTSSIVHIPNVVQQHFEQEHIFSSSRRRRHYCRDEEPSQNRHPFSNP